MNGADVVIATENQPPHPSYYYGEGHPSFAPFDGTGTPNPNLIVKQPVELVVPGAPAAKGLVIDQSLVDGNALTVHEAYRGGVVGIALDGVNLFAGFAAPGDTLEAETPTFDGYAAHPAPNGMYHYHAPSRGPLEVLDAAGLGSGTTPGAATVELFGVMCDGTLILGCTELDGSPPETAGLDAQGGHAHDVGDGTTTYFADRYHTHVCASIHPFAPEIQYYDRCN
jgi:hypothetical protein